VGLVKKIKTPILENARMHYESQINIHDGIGVQLSTTKSHITHIFPLAEHKTNKVFIRGFSLLDENSGLVYKSYEEVLYILLHNVAPEAEKLMRFKNTVCQYMSVDSKMSNLLLQIESLEDKPLILLQISLLSLAYDDEVNSSYIIARAFVLVANIFNKYVGRKLVHPNPDLGLIENLLYMIGKDHTDPILVKNFTNIMIAWMEMGLAPSAIATRINASSHTDIISALVAGVVNTTGEKHTSARIKSMRLLKEIDHIIQSMHLSLVHDTKVIKKLIHAKLQAMLDKNEIISGFGHYIFKNLDDNGIDPRIFLVERAIKEIYVGDTMLVIINIMRELFQEGQLLKAGKVLILPPNSDIYWSAFLYNFFLEYSNQKNMDSVASLFNILTRMSGLLAHYDEQRRQKDTMKVWGWITK
jgi:citrate synthase